MGAVVKCLRILRREKPQAVIGVGGYVSVPTSVAAYLLRIPLFLQEQNTSVGIANRFLGKLSRKIFLGFQQAHRFFPAEKCLLTGNPIRQEFFSPQFPRYRPEPSHLLVMGGSQGAHAINDAMIECLPKLKENYPQLHIQHQTGVKDCPRVQKAYAQSFPIKSEVATFDVTPFIDDVVRAYGKANLVVARSGALTISELIQVKRPAIFVPYPRKGQNDQLTNAYFMETEGVARVVEQGEDFNSRFWLTLKEILDADVLFRMANHFSKFQSTSALTLIGDEIQSSIGL
jgi:UDP-N-acetylglucosamine--N-acetylmuramyl-(pentapeptide) pyrophosphoryl-undecaprenol N-acetylglucosamine transferase